MTQAHLEKHSIPEPNTGCWLWVGTRLTAGYGQVGGGGSKRLELAHRASWRLHFGEIPAGLHVLHSCDTPPCVNPDHLFLGTRSDNMRDCASKGRCHGLSPQIVTAIRAQLNGPRRHGLQRELARRYGVTDGVISAIKSGRTFAGLKGAVTRRHLQMGARAEGFA